MPFVLGILALLLKNSSKLHIKKYIQNQVQDK